MPWDPYVNKSGSKGGGGGTANIANTTAILKGDNAGNAVAANATDIPDLSSTYLTTNQKANASGVASLDAGSKVIQNPTNSNATPTANKIPIAGGAGTLDVGWIPDLSALYTLAEYTVGKSTGCATLTDAITTCNALGTRCRIVVPAGVTETISADTVVNAEVEVDLSQRPSITIGTVALANTFTYTDTADGGVASTFATTGNTDGSTAVITNVASVGFLQTGMKIYVAAGFPTTGPFRVISFTATTITVDTNSNSAQVGTAITCRALINTDTTYLQTKFYERFLGVGFINVGGVRKRPLKLTGNGTGATDFIMMQEFPSAFTTQAWSYSTTTLVGDGSDTVSGDIVIINGETFLVGKVNTTTNIRVDHHPRAEFSGAQAGVRYYRLKFNGPVIMPNGQVFTTPGVWFNGKSVDHIIPEWFGATGQYKPTDGDSVDHDDTEAMRTAQMCGALLYPNLLRSKEVKLTGTGYKISGAVNILAPTVGNGMTTTWLMGAITDYGPLVLMGGGSNDTNGIQQHGQKFWDIGLISGSSTQATGMVLDYMIKGKVRAYSYDLYNAYVLWENWECFFDLNGRANKFSMFGSIGGAKNTLIGSLDAPYYGGVDLGGNCIVGYGSDNDIQLMCEGSPSYSFYIGGNAYRNRYKLYSENGSGMGYTYIGCTELLTCYSGGSEMRECSIHLSGHATHNKAYFGRLMDCKDITSNIPWEWVSNQYVPYANVHPPFPPVRPGASVLSNNFKLPYVKLFNPPDNYWPNPFFKYGLLRGFKKVTANNVTPTCSANTQWDERMYGGALKLAPTSGQADCWMEFEFEPAVVAAMAGSNSQDYQDGWQFLLHYKLSSNWTAGFFPNMTALYSTDGIAFTETDKMATDDTLSINKGGWTYQLYNPTTSNNASALWGAVPNNIKRLKIRIYCNTTATTAGGGIYMLISGVYWGRQVIDTQALAECRWNDGVGGLQIGKNLISPIAKYYLSSQTIAIDKDANTLVRTTGSFITDGVLPGDTVTLSGCTTGANDGNYHVIDTPTSKTVTGAVDNGSGAIRLTVGTHGYADNSYVTVASVGGVPNATGTWKIDWIDANTFDLVGSTFGGLYTSGGTVFQCPVGVDTATSDTFIMYDTTTGDNTSEAGSGSQILTLLPCQDSSQTWAKGDGYRNSMSASGSLPEAFCITPGAGGTAVFSGNALP